MSPINLVNLKDLLVRHKVIEVRTVLLNDFMDIESTIGAVCDLLKDYPTIPYKLIRAHLIGLKKQQKNLFGIGYYQKKQWNPIGSLQLARALLIYMYKCSTYIREV
jgi:pyruvate-formate lyase-activating enzyme